MLKSVQNGVADFDYFLIQKVNRFMNKVINLMLSLLESTSINFEWWLGNIFIVIIMIIILKFTF